MKTWIKLAGLLVGVGATVAFAWYAVHALQGQDLSAYTAPAALRGLVLCTLLYIATLPLSAWAWRQILLARGVDKSVADLTQLMSVSQLGKYAPGNVGALLGRAAMGAGVGIPTKPLLGSILVEAGMVAYTGIAVGTLALLVARVPEHLGYFRPWLAYPVLLACLAAPWIALRLMGRLEVLPPAPVLVRVFCAYALVYLLVGFGLWLLGRTALSYQVQFPALLCASFALGWIAGFFTPGAPAGLGVREGLMLLILQLAYSPANALFLVIGFRLATLAGDAMLFLLGSLGLLLRRSATRNSTVQPHMPTTVLNLEPTGERLIQEHYLATPQDHVIHLMHEATYRFAARFVPGKRVLDYGCGSGYGSAQVARLARSVVGVDVAPDAVAYAAGKFQSPNLAYQVIDPAQPLPFPTDSFDTVLSFQVFEHVADTDRYLSEIRRVLVPGGTLVMATPDRSTRLLPGHKPWNRWHLHEYSADELEQVLRRHFPAVDMLGMGGTPEVINIEIRRCAKVKWLTWPFTLAFLPDAWRVAGLNLIHKLRGPAARTGAATPCPFSIDDIHIAQGIAPSVNLVAVARAGEV